MRKILFCAVLVYSTVLSSAQVSNTRLWEVSHPNIKFKSYLIGTVHSGFEGLFDFNDSLYWAIDQSDLVALELDNEDISFASASNAMSSSREMSYLMLECILELLPEYKNTNTDTLVKRYLKGMKSFNAMDVEEEGVNGRSMVFDDFITAYARFKNKEVDGIETMSDQLNVIFSFNKPQLTDVLRKFFDNKERFSAKMDGDSIVFYAAKNQSVEICNLFNEMTADPVWGSYYKRILDDRNVNMVNYVIENSKKTAMTCAVGLGHMCGENGIVSLLKKEGYSIRPMNMVTPTKKNRPIVWTTHKTDDFTTVVPTGVDTVIERASYLGLNTMLSAFSKFQKKQKNIYIEPAGAVYFEYSVETSYEDDYDTAVGDAVEAAVSATDEETNFEKSLAEYIDGMRDEDAEENIEVIWDEDEENKIEDVDLNVVADAMEASAENSKEETDKDQEDENEETEEPKKEYASRFVEFWAKVNQGRLTDAGGLYNTEEEESPKIDTLSLGDGYGMYKITYDDDIVMEYTLPENKDITLRIRGDENVMKREELLDYFKKAKLIKKD